MLLVAVGLEARFFERLLDEPRQRAMTIFAVVMLCVGEALAISALPKSNQGCDDLLSGWHEYTAFVLTLEACFVALATLMWALISPSDQARRERQAFRTRPRLKARRGPTRAGTDRPRRRRPDPP